MTLNTKGITKPFCICRKNNEKSLTIKLCCFLFILIATQNNLYSQQNCLHEISGRVLDKDNNEPLPGVLLKEINSEKFTVSDEKGYYTLENLCFDYSNILVSSVGYNDSIYNITKDKSDIFLYGENIELNSVLIFEERDKYQAPKTISQQLINLDERGLNRTFSLASLASEIDGVTFISSGSNVEIPVIHGLYGNRILVLNNYLKHGFQNWGKDHAPEINMASVSNIKIVKGSSGVRFGPEGLGGALVVEPDPMKLQQPIYLNLFSGYETNGRGQNYGFKTGGGSNKIGFYISGNYIKIGDRHAPDYMLTNSGKKEKSINVGLHYHLQSFDIKLYYNNIYLDNGLLRSSIFSSGNAIIRALDSESPLFVRPFSYSIKEPNQIAKHELSKANINWWINDEEKLSLTIGLQKNERKEYDVRRNSYKPITNLELFTSDYLLEWDHTLSDDIDGIFGIHYLRQDNNNLAGTGTTPFIPNYNSNRFSMYLVEGFRSNNNLFEIGLRYDNENYNVRGRETNQDIFRDENSFSNFTFSLGFEKEISSQISFRSNIGSAWRTPNMAELYSYGSHGFKTTFGLLRYYFNDNAKVRTNKVLKMSEQSFTSEKSLKFINEFNFTSERTNLKFTFYTNYILNFIFEKPIGLFGTIRGPMPYFIYDQTDIILIGSDITFKREISEKIKSTSTFSYILTENINEGGNLIDQPPLRVSNKFDWTTNYFWKLTSSEVSLIPSYTFRQYMAPNTITPYDLINNLVQVDSQSEIFDFKDAPNGYFLLDLSWKFEINNMSASFLIKNILNKRYRNYLNQMRYFADEPGRNFIFNISYKF